MRHAITSRRIRDASLRREAILLRLAIAPTGEALEHTQHWRVSKCPHQAQANTTPRVARERAPDELCLSHVRLSLYLSLSLSLSLNVFM